MRKIIYSLFMILFVIGFVSCSEEEELQILSPVEVNNFVATTDLHYMTEPTSVDLYIGHYLSGKGLDLTRPTYVSIQPHAGELNEKIAIIDSNGDEVNGRYLLPDVFYTPEMVDDIVTQTIFLQTEYSTTFKLRLPVTGEESFKVEFDILLYQPDSDKEYIIKDCGLTIVRGTSYDENGNIEYDWIVVGGKR